MNAGVRSNMITFSLGVLTKTCTSNLAAAIPFRFNPRNDISLRFAKWLKSTCCISPATASLPMCFVNPFGSCSDSTAGMLRLITCANSTPSRRPSPFHPAVPPLNANLVGLQP
eukprot:Platyproteum_vivax@DN5979_c0_g1_i3.p1